MKESATDSARDTVIINYISVLCAKSHTRNRTVGENTAWDKTDNGNYKFFVELVHTQSHHQRSTNMQPRLNTLY